jgi:hypothetical protein
MIPLAKATVGLEEAEAVRRERRGACSTFRSGRPWGISRGCSILYRQTFQDCLCSATGAVGLRAAQFDWLDRSWGCAMPCHLCGSGNQEDFTAEINIHFRGLKNLDRPGVLIIPKLSICLDCGFSRFTTPETALAQLASGTRTSEASTQRHSASDVALRRANCA